MQAKSIVTWVLCIALALFFLSSAYPKLTQNPQVVDMFDKFGHSTGFMLLIGLLEALGAVLLLFPRLATWGAGILAVVMVGAAYTHISTGIGSPAMAIVALVLAAVVAWLRKPDAIGLGG